MPKRTRIKICGLTREEDVVSAVEAGADAIGFVFYPPSSRAIDPDRALQLVRLVPPFVTTVGLFVNAEAGDVRAAIDAAGLQLLQFHGDEDEAACNRFGVPYIKAARMRPGIDLINYATSFPSARGILVDAYVDGFGGGGKVFDWGLIPEQGLDKPLILSGGLNSDNVTEAVARVRPWAVDVSSGVEQAKGIKDPQRIAAFVAGVRHADG